MKKFEKDSFKGVNGEDVGEAMGKDMPDSTPRTVRARADVSGGQIVQVQS